MPARPPDLPALRAVLLGLFAEQPSAPAPALSPASWQTLDAMAAEHRLQPLLHHRHRDNPDIPAEIRAAWRTAHRASALAALQLAADLRDACALLDAAGLRPIALKGAWLAWHAYPQAALRPMRDIDLLLTPETVVEGFECLQAAGYTLIGPQELAMADAVRLDKHMPPLLTPHGTVLELHQRLWEIDGRMDHAAPAAAERAIGQRAIEAGGLRFIHPQDLLAHLIIHAAYDHRLDCGPLVLADIAALLRASPIDWPRFWASARAEGWLRGACLILALADEHAPGLGIAFPPDLPPLPADYRTLAANLLLQNLATRQSAGVVATLRAAGPRAFADRLLARRRTPDQTAAQPGVARDLSHVGGFGGWAWSRLSRTLGELARPDVRGQSGRLARLSRWLEP